MLIVSQDRQYQTENIEMVIAPEVNSEGETGRKKLQGIDALAYMFITDVIKEIKKEPEADPWIMCSKQLPKDASKVLITRYNTELKFRIIEIDCYDGYGKWGNDDNFNMKIWKVTAWKPLPEPFKEKGTL